MDLKTRFRQELWPVNPTGDYEKAFTSLEFVLGWIKDQDGNELTFDFVLRRFKEYNEYIDSRNMGREKQFYTKKKNLFEYLEERMFLQDFKASDKNQYLDYYLYGEGEKL
ncbi:MAG: hypothetical protein ACQER7_15565 [Bacteroidota bacterium]